MEAAGEKMTYDELLEFIQKDINDAAFERKEYYPSRSLLALKSVVELCKPIDSDEVYPENKLWKNLVIEAIEKELG